MSEIALEHTGANGARPLSAAAPIDVADPVLMRVEGVTKTWRKAPAPVLQDVNLTLPDGTASWIGGRNGIGKTTLLRIMSGVLRPDEGRITLCGVDVEKERRRFHSEIGFLSAANHNLYARLTIKAHLDTWSRVSFIPKSERRDAIDAMVDRFMLGDLLKRRCDRLSMGQRQRVRLALVFMHSPLVVLLDEPRNSLDTEGIAVVREAVEMHVEEGGAAVVCSPSGETPLMDFDHEYEMVDGRLEQL